MPRFGDLIAIDPKDEAAITHLMRGATPMSPSDLKQWRTARNLTQDDLAHLLGVSTNSVYRWEQGSRAIPPYLSLALQTLSRRVKRKA